MGRRQLISQSQLAEVIRRASAFRFTRAQITSLENELVELDDVETTLVPDLEYFVGRLIRWRASRQMRAAVDASVTARLRRLRSALEDVLHAVDGKEVCSIATVCVLRFHLGEYLRNKTPQLEVLLATLGVADPASNSGADQFHSRASKLRAQSVRYWMQDTAVISRTVKKILENEPRRRRGTPGDKARDHFAADVLAVLRDAGEPIKKGPTSSTARVLCILLRAAGERTGYTDASRLITRALKLIAREEQRLRDFEIALEQITPRRAAT